MAFEYLINSPLTNIKQKGQIMSVAVDTYHPEYLSYMTTWKKCRDATIGQKAIKAAGEKYLAKMNGQHPDEYENYKERAQWYGATGRTVESYLGMVFRKAPHLVIKSEDTGIDPELETLDKDKYYNFIGSNGKSFTSFSRDIIKEVIQVNRVGVLIDYPKVESLELLKGMSKYDVERLNYKPLLSMYKTEAIINWHYEYINNVPVPVLFVLKESIYDSFSGINLSPVKVDIFRVLFLEPYYDEDGLLKGRYKELSFREYVGSVKTSDGSVSYIAESVTYPLINGEYLDYLPFYVLDDTGINYGEISDSMIYDLAETNIGHFRNSADWENELHMVGAKTAIFPGWDKKTHGNPRLGGALACPKDCKPEMLEATSDSGIFEEMKEKETRMSVLGAERISQKGRYMPSTETAKLNTASEASTLTSMSTALSEAFSDILSKQIQWDKVKPYIVDVTLNTDYYQDDITGDELLKWMDAYQRGGISYDIYYYNLEKREAFPPEWDKDRELVALEETLERQNKIHEEKYLELYERISELENVNATITTTSTGNTMTSMSSIDGGAGQSTSAEIPAERMQTAEARNNEIVKKSSNNDSSVPIN